VKPLERSGTEITLVANDAFKETAILGANDFPTYELETTTIDAPICLQIEAKISEVESDVKPSVLLQFNTLLAPYLPSSALFAIEEILTATTSLPINVPISLA
jgi:hypothetical protein